MTGPRARRNAEPTWCATTHPSPENKHTSKPVNVRGDIGGVRAWLVQRNTAEPQVVLNAHLATGITVDLSVAGARALRDGLTDLLRQADTD